MKCVLIKRGPSCGRDVTVIREVTLTTSLFFTGLVSPTVCVVLRDGGPHKMTDVSEVPFVRRITKCLPHTLGPGWRCDNVCRTTRATCLSPVVTKTHTRARTVTVVVVVVTDLQPSRQQSEGDGVWTTLSSRRPPGSSDTDCSGGLVRAQTLGDVTP